MNCHLAIKGSNEAILTGLEKLLGHTEQGKSGIEQMNTVMAQLKDQSINIQLDPTLARGLNYYTGLIFEAKAPATVSIGSIGGGGRYDDLTGLFGVKDITWSGYFIWGGPDL